MMMGLGCMHSATAWLLFCTVIVLMLNLLLMSQAPSILRPSDPTREPKRRVKLHHAESSTRKIYSRGEIFALRNSEYQNRKKQKRNGLNMIHKVWFHLPKIQAQFSSLSPALEPMVEMLTKEMILQRNLVDPWKLASNWITPKALVPENASGLGDVVRALSENEIVYADVGYKGTQLKMLLVLKGKQSVVFKPQWYKRNETMDGESYSGADRHNGEVASFHLSRLLALRMVPVAVGRRVSLREHILPVASGKLAQTFFNGTDGSTCFYGICHYCHKNASVCDDPKWLEGTVIYFLPEKFSLWNHPHPWARTYNISKPAQWEMDAKYCNLVRSNPLYSEDSSQRLLDLLDTAVFDFLIQNGDRHHYSVFRGIGNSSIVLLDNGKSFGDAFIDHLDILAPLLQCCRLRQSTYERLVSLSGGGLSLSLRKLLSHDPIAPVLNEAHLLALDRRVHQILAVMAMCNEGNGGWHRVLY